MLESLTIRHVALIDEATICFHPGMQVMTGETGAGKSIVVDSVNLILGGRADRDLIRTGCEKASVEAAFSVRNNRQVLDYLKEEGVEVVYLPRTPEISSTQIRKTVHWTLDEDERNR